MSSVEDLAPRVTLPHQPNLTHSQFNPTEIFISLDIAHTAWRKLKEYDD